jgi:hypothetical protein
MDKKLQDKLFKKYPKIFRDRNRSIRESCMGWGIETGNGWYWLIDNLCNSIQSYLDHNMKDFQVVAQQVKEKYGTLRFYVSGEPDIIHGMIWLAESMSAHICEQCGSTEDVQQTEGWLVSLCPIHMVEYKKKRGLK